MITNETLKDVIALIDAKDAKRIANSDKEYCVIELHTFNAGSFVRIRLTNDFNKYKHVCNSGNALFDTWEVKEMLNPES